MSIQIRAIAKNLINLVHKGFRVGLFVGRKILDLISELTNVVRHMIKFKIVCYSLSSTC
jgi:hypothetical protein